MDTINEGNDNVLIMAEGGPSRYSQLNNEESAYSYPKSRREETQSPVSAVNKLDADK
tara:strand:- start:4 stop:174 length:171 start_codon:yes stop_codon:yes gene_type:complete